MLPIEVPVLGALGVGVFVLAISRILIAVSHTAVYFIFGGVALLVMVIASVLSLKPKMNQSLIAALCVVGALAVLCGGVASAIVGPREIEPHHEEHGETEGEEHEGAPLLHTAATLGGEAS
jgi:hypothetical protein